VTKQLFYSVYDDGDDDDVRLIFDDNNDNNDYDNDDYIKKLQAVKKYALYTDQPKRF
jgi:hypothetical protein